MIDTGADDTILRPSDVRRSGRASRWRPPDSTSIRIASGIEGVGGGGYIIPVSARLFFRTDTGTDRLSQDARVWVAQPTDANQRMPSLLGRDLLQFFRLTVDYEATPPVLLEQS